MEVEDLYIRRRSRMTVPDWYFTISENGTGVHAPF